MKHSISLKIRLLIGCISINLIIPPLLNAHTCTGIYQLNGTHESSAPGVSDLNATALIDDAGQLTLLASSVNNDVIFLQQTIPVSGRFSSSGLDANRSAISGNCSSVVLKGTYTVNSVTGTSLTGTYIGRKVSAEGAYRDAAGYYTGQATFPAGLGIVSREVRGILLGDGLVHLVMAITSKGFSKGEVDTLVLPFNEQGNITGETYDAARVTLNINQSARTITGTYSGNAGNRTLSLTRVIAATAATNLIGDFNQDGKADILWQNQQTGVVHLYLMNGPVILQSFQLARVLPVWKIQGQGDFDGNGSTDILFRHENTGEVWVYLMNKTSIATSVSVVKVTDLNWEIVKIADQNGDGRSDIFWRHKVNGTNWLYIMNGAQIQASNKVNIVPDLNWEVQ